MKKLVLIIKALVVVSYAAGTNSEAEEVFAKKSKAMNNPDFAYLSI